MMIQIIQLPRNTTNPQGTRSPDCSSHLCLDTVLPDCMFMDHTPCNERRILKVQMFGRNNMLQLTIPIFVNSAERFVRPQAAADVSTLEVDEQPGVGHLVRSAPPTERLRRGFHFLWSLFNISLAQTFLSSNLYFSTCPSCTKFSTFNDCSS